MSIPALSNPLAVTEYLKDKGWKVSKSTVYGHLKEGKIKSIDGVFGIKDVEKYAGLHLKRTDGTSPAERPSSNAFISIRRLICNMQSSFWRKRSAGIKRPRMSNGSRLEAGIITFWTVKFMLLPVPIHPGHPASGIWQRLKKQRKLKQNRNRLPNRNRRSKRPQKIETGPAGSTRGDDMTEATVNALQVTKMLSCSRSHAYRLIESGEMTAYCTGKRRGLRILVSSIEAFVERRKEAYAVVA
jgi:excisionase family DNA binding protein